MFCFNLLLCVAILSRILIRLLKHITTFNFTSENDAKVKTKTDFEKPAKLHDLSAFIYLICHSQKQRFCDASFSEVDLEELDGAMKKITMLCTWAEKGTKMKREMKQQMFNVKIKK